MQQERTQPEPCGNLPQASPHEETGKDFSRSLLASCVLHGLLFLVLAGFDESLLFAFMREEESTRGPAAEGTLFTKISLGQVTLTRPLPAESTPKLPPQQITPAPAPLPQPGKVPPKAVPEASNISPAAPVEGTQKNTTPQTNKPGNETVALANQHLGEGFPGAEQNSPLRTALNAKNGPRFIRAVAPEYPKTARLKGIEGTVVLELTIDEAGALVSSRVVQSAGPDLDQAATNALRKARFSPATRDGKPVRSIVPLPVPFTLIR